MKKALLLGCALLLSSLPSSAWKTASGFSTDWASVQMEQKSLSDHVTFLHGSGGNMLVSTGPDGIVLVDCEFSPMSDKIKAAVAKLQPGPIRFLIDTHWHIDHAGGNADFAKDGTVIIAQDHVRSRLSTQQPAGYFGNTVPPSPPAAWPLITFDRSMTLHFNGENIMLLNDGVAHTDGDAIVYFPKSNVVHMGDVYINGLYPIIDLASHGTIQGYFPIIDHVLGMINDQTRVIPGHGPIGTKADLLFYRNMLATLRDRVQKMITEGKTLDEITAANVSKDFDNDWASDRVGPKAITKMIYESLTGPKSLTSER
jgi:glyoxylase-like metal-dependent hydrolase (beta-lactamase superfamily II)